MSSEENEVLSLERNLRLENTVTSSSSGIHYVKKYASSGDEVVGTLSNAKHLTDSKRLFIFLRDQSSVCIDKCDKHNAEFWQVFCENEKVIWTYVGKKHGFLLKPSNTFVQRFKIFFHCTNGMCLPKRRNNLTLNFEIIMNDMNPIPETTVVYHVRISTKPKRSMELLETKPVIKRSRNVFEKEPEKRDRHKEYPRKIERIEKSVHLLQNTVLTLQRQLSDLKDELDAMRLEALISSDSSDDS